MLRLKVITSLDGYLEVNGAFREGFSLCKNETPSWCCSESAKSIELGFRALLTEGTAEVHLERAVVRQNLVD